MKRSLQVAAATFVALVIAILAPFAWLIWIALGTKTFDGPTSPSGIVVLIGVTDAVRWNPGSDYYADVSLHTTNWNRCQWNDCDGQDSMENVKMMISSMEWTDNSTLEFDCANGKSMRIQLRDGLWKTEEFRKERQQSGGAYFLPEAVKKSAHP